MNSFNTDSEQYFQQQQSSVSPNTVQDTGEIRTVFVSGLPEDVKEREIHNLFRLVPGYEGCKMAMMNQRHISFVSFLTREAAANAIQQLNGIKFDPDIDFTLRLEFARANSKVKRLVNDSGNQQEKRRRVQPFHQNGGFGYGQYGGYSDGYSYGYNDPYSHVPMHNMIPSHNQLAVHTPFSRLTPCTTLFVTGIDPTVTQNDLLSIFSTGPGFSRFRIGKDGTHCFLDYTDLNSSAMALNALNNYQLGSCRLRVDYAKKKMGETRSHDRGENQDGNTQAS